VSLFQNSWIVQFGPAGMTDPLWSVFGIIQETIGVGQGTFEFNHETFGVIQGTFGVVQEFFNINIQEY
jgi:hypothetical protein